MKNEEAYGWLQAHVSRETLNRLSVFHELLQKWQPTINLVAPATLPEVWARHFADSAQLFFSAQRQPRTWLDLGSGGGFPGLVIAAIAKERTQHISVTLVESDVRKCGFLREAARLMDLAVTVCNSRISELPIQPSDVISARALASLEKLIEYACPHTHEDSQLVFPKGANFQAELETIPIDWQTNARVIPSVTDPDARILYLHPPSLSREA